MISKIRNRIIDFSKNQKINPIIYGIAIGLYPMLYYYDRNFSLVNSWSQLTMFLLVFILLPMVVCFVIQKISKVTSYLGLIKFALPIFNLVYFFWLVVISTLGQKLEALALAGLLGTLLGFTLRKYLNKIIIFQLLLALVISPKLVPNILYQINYRTDWIQQPDAILSAKFRKMPNVYVIQPDGYANFHELGRGYYTYNNNEFEDFLKQKGFKTYPGFRSNYISTLSSNSSMFSMKHHYFNNPRKGSNEVYNSRDIIVGKNAVVEIFNNNGYYTNLVLEKSYLLVNRPKMGYDYCNIESDKLSFLARGFEINRNITDDLKACMNKKNMQPQFYFIEKLKPGHISTTANLSKGTKEEREGYLEELNEANLWLMDTVEFIEQSDPNALIVIMADHGGYVGFDYVAQNKIKQTDPDLIKSIYTAALAIKWPDGIAPEYDAKLKTNVNLFRILIAYLSEDKILLEHLQADKSYTVIEKGAPFGVYEYIDEDYTTVFNKWEHQD